MLPAKSSEIVTYTFPKTRHFIKSELRLIRRLPSLSTVENPLEIIETETHFTIKARKYDWPDISGLRLVPLDDEESVVSVTYNSIDDLFCIIKHSENEWSVANEESLQND